MKRLPANFTGQAVRTVCLFCALLLAVQGIAWGQHKSHRLTPRYLSNSSPDPERGREILAKFRNLGLAGDYYLEFNLEILPRKGDRTVVPGQMWGARNAQGPVFRVTLNDNETGQPIDRLLGHNGPNPSAWRLADTEGAQASAQPIQLDASTLLDPIGGTELSMFELQMPFIHWTDHVYEGTTRVRGRAVHAFLMYPPEDFAAAHPEIAGVRLHLDANFHALMQAVFLDADEIPERKLTVLDLKKLGEQWIVKTIDIRDEHTRDKVRFEVTAAALNLDFSPRLFDAEELGADIAPPENVVPLRW